MKKNLASFILIYRIPLSHGFRTFSSNRWQHSQTIFGTSSRQLRATIKVATYNERHHTHPPTRVMALFPGLPRWAGTRKDKPIWILLKHETVNDSGIRWAMCKSAPRSRLITTPAPHHSFFSRPDALPAAQPTVSMHWRQRKTSVESKLYLRHQ